MAAALSGEYSCASPAGGPAAGAWPRLPRSACVRRGASMFRKCAAVLGLAASLLVAPAAEAAREKPSARDEARQRFERAVVLYEAGDFSAALAEFEAAYQAVPR